MAFGLQRLVQSLPYGGDPPPKPVGEVTTLTPQEESAFQDWVKQNKFTDVDHPDAHYDYRGFWKATAGAPHPPGSVAHFPDTFKQHGHPTFSQESQYSAGPSDGGMWVGDTLLQQPKLAVSHQTPEELMRLVALMKGAR